MFVHFLYSRDFYFTGARESPNVDLPRLKKTNQKKRRFFLGIFTLSGKTTTSSLNFLQGFENF